MNQQIQNAVVETAPDKLFLDNGYTVSQEFSSGNYCYTKTVEYEGVIFVISTTDNANTEPEYLYSSGDNLYGCWNFSLNDTEYDFYEEPWTKFGDKFSLTGPEKAVSLEEVELYYIRAYNENKRREEEERLLKLGITN